MAPNIGDGPGSILACEDALHTGMEERKRAEDELRVAISERTRLAAVRADIGLALARKDSLTGVLQACAEALVRHLEASFARIWTFNSQANQLELQASAGKYTRLDGRYSRIPFGERKIGLIAKERKPHLTNDIQNDPRIGDKDWARAENMTAFAGYPLVVEDRIVGVMGMFSQKPFTESTLETLSFVADGIAQGIERKHAEYTQQRQESARIYSEEQYRVVVETASDAVVSIDDTGSIVFANPATSRIFGYNSSELVGKPLTLLMPEYMRQLHQSGFERYLATGQRHINWQGTELTALRRNGEEFPVEISFGELIKDRHKIFTGFIRDISKRKQAEQALLRNEEFLAQGQRLSRIGSYSWRAATGEITWSDELYRIYELEPPATPASIRTRIHPEDLSLYDQMVEQARSGAADFESHYRLVMPDGSIKYLHAVAHATHDKNGQLEYIAAVQDVTARRLSEEALEKARSELARVSRLTTMGEFAASIAHEVNQPLTAVTNNANACLRLLASHKLDTEVLRRVLEEIVADSSRASAVISRIRALIKKMPAEKSPLDVNEIIREVSALAGHELQKRGVMLEFELAGRLPLVRADRVELQQVLLNLTMNAIEAMAPVTDRPRVLCMQSQVDQSGDVLVAVCDSGPGLGADADRLFTPFFTTKANGLGIGLSISRSLVESHSGCLQAAANSPYGAVFSFTLPAASAAAS